MIYLKDKNLHAALKEERIFFTRINNTLIRKYGKENLKRYHDNRMNGMSVEEAERDADRTFPPKHSAATLRHCAREETMETQIETVLKPDRSIVFETRKDVDDFVKSSSTNDADGCDILFYQMANGKWHLEMFKISELEDIHVCQNNTDTFSPTVPESSCPVEPFPSTYRQNS